MRAKPGKSFVTESVLISCSRKDEEDDSAFKKRLDRISAKMYLYDGITKAPQAGRWHTDLRSGKSEGIVSFQNLDDKAMLSLYLHDLTFSISPPFAKNNPSSLHVAAD